MVLVKQNNRSNSDIISGNTFSRKFGHSVHPADPHVSGYFYVFFDLPPIILEYLSTYDEGEEYKSTYGNRDFNSNFENSRELSTILTATCTGLTSIPSGSNNKIEYACQGGTKYSEAGFMEYVSEVSLKFVEMAGMPIFKILSAWANVIKHKTMGNTIYDDSVLGKGIYSKRNYTGYIYYCTVRPDGCTPEYYACYEGVFPLKDPHDPFQSDVTDVSAREIDISFNVDYVWQEPWVYDICMKRIENVMSHADGIYKYKNSSNQSTVQVNNNTLPNIVGDIDGSGFRGFA